MANELDTWVFKNGRQDHMDGCHDDTLTCAAMGIFVFQFNMNKMEAVKERDKSFLKAWVSSNGETSNKANINSQIMIDPNKVKRGNYGVDPFALLGIPKTPVVPGTAKYNQTVSDPKKAACLWIVR